MPLRYKPEKTSASRTDAGARVMQWVRVVGDDDNNTISLSANACGHLTCSGEETVILFMRPDQPTVALKIAKSPETVTQADVVEVLQPILSPRRVIPSLPGLTLRIHCLTRIVT
jgi:hypothetical protein